MNLESSTGKTKHDVELLNHDAQAGGGLGSGFGSCPPLSEFLRLNFPGSVRTAARYHVTADVTTEACQISVFTFDLR